MPATAATTLILIPQLQDMHNRLTLDMDPKSRAIKNTRVLTIHGSADSVIPVEDAHSFRDHIANSELSVVDGADHSYT